VKFGNISVKLGNTSVKFGNISVKFGNISVKVGNISVKFGNTGVKHCPHNIGFFLFSVSSYFRVIGEAHVEPPEFFRVFPWTLFDQKSVFARELAKSQAVWCGE
jgi:hypothetical protein